MRRSTEGDQRGLATEALFGGKETLGFLPDRSEVPPMPYAVPHSPTDDLPRAMHDLGGPLHKINAPRAMREVDGDFTLSVKVGSCPIRLAEGAAAFYTDSSCSTIFFRLPVPVEQPCTTWKSSVA